MQCALLVHVLWAAAANAPRATRTGSADPFTLWVNASNVTHAVQPRTLGCHSDSGYVHNARALMAELLHGPCFDSGIGPAWTIDGSIVPDKTLLFFNNKTSLKLSLPSKTSEKGGVRRVSAANRGLGGGGLALEGGRPYSASVWVRPASSPAQGSSTPKLWVSAALEDHISNTTLATATQPVPTTGGWTKLSFDLTPVRGTACESIAPDADPTIKCTDPRPQQPGEAPYPLYSVGHLCLRCSGQVVFSLSDSPSLTGPGHGHQPVVAASATVHFGYPSLLPGPWGLWKGMAVSSRNVPFLTRMGTRLMRLGGSFASAPSWLWTEWRGPPHMRPASACSGASSDFAGWGMFDFLDFVAAAGIDGVVTTTLGTPTESTCESKMMVPFLYCQLTRCFSRAVADLVEYALGNTSTAMGSLRAADGHPLPYALKLLELGNEGSAAQGLWLDAVEAMEQRSTELGLPNDKRLSYIFSDQNGLKGENATRAAKMGLGARLLTDIHVYYEWNGPALAQALFDAEADVLPAQGAIVMETNDACYVPHDMTRAVIEASQLNQHLRADMPRLAGRAASFCFESASGFYDAFDQGLVFFSQNMTFGQPPYHVHAMVADTMQPHAVAVSPSDGELHGTKLDFTAGLSANGSQLTIRALNRDNVTARTVNIVLSGHACPPSEGCLVKTTTLSAAMDAVNTHASPERVKPLRSVSRWPGTVPIGRRTGHAVQLPPYSFTVFVIELR